MCTSKILTDLCFRKTKNKNKKWFCKSCLQCFSSENVLIKHKEDCLIVNCKQSVKLEEEIIEFENYYTQIPIPLKIYADFECNLRGVESYEGPYTKKYQYHVLFILLTKLFVLVIRLLSQLLFLEVKMLLMNLSKQFLRSVTTAKKKLTNTLTKI